MLPDATIEDLRRKPKAAFVITVDGMSLVLMAPAPIAKKKATGDANGGDEGTRRYNEDDDDVGVALDGSRIAQADTRIVGRLAVSNLVLVAIRRRAFDEMRAELGGFGIEEVSALVVPRCVPLPVVLRSDGQLTFHCVAGMLASMLWRSRTPSA